MKVHRIDVANLMQSTTGDHALKLWHHCLANLNVCLYASNLVNGKTLGKFSCSTSLLFYEAYMECKQHRAKFLDEGGDKGPSH